jgi:hypothetical protein
MPEVCESSWRIVMFPHDAGAPSRYFAALSSSWSLPSCASSTTAVARIGLQMDAIL